MTNALAGRHVVDKGELSAVCFAVTALSKGSIWTIKTHEIVGTGFNPFEPCGRIMESTNGKSSNP